MENNLFPFIDPLEVEIIEDEIPIAREYAYDFKRGDFKLKNGKLYIVEGNEAIKIWIEKALITGRYKEIIHTWIYGSEFEDKIIGLGYTKGLIKAEAERYTRECINATLSDYVVSMNNFDISFMDSTLTIAFKVETIYGEVDIVAQL